MYLDGVVSSALSLVELVRKLTSSCVFPFGDMNVFWLSFSNRRPTTSACKTLYSLNKRVVITNAFGAVKQNHTAICVNN